MQEGLIVLSASGSYFPEAIVTADFIGTSSCVAGQTISEMFDWWPAPAFQVSIMPNGWLEESLPETMIGTKKVTEQWSLSPMPMP
jgi:hypothetical protein